ncbi:MAG: hypothetical protein QM731_28010 [Chitinophagaceae bacterium]
MFTSHIHLLQAMILSAGLGVALASMEGRIKYHPQAFAHNDYKHKRPLLDAVNNGFRFVEADIYLSRGKLIVSHGPPVFTRRRTLKDLYLTPLFDTTEFFTIETEPINLVIDMKTGGKTLDSLWQLLRDYKSMLSSLENDQFIKRKITIILSGKIPRKLSAEQAKYLFLDSHCMPAQRHRESLPEKQYLMSSCRFSSLLTWDGNGEIPEEDKEKLLLFVSHAHASGRKARLWASPEKSQVWKTLLDCGVDLINTDKLDKLNKFLSESSTTQP